MNGMRVKIKRIEGTSRNIIRSIMILRRRRKGNRTITGVGVTTMRITIGVKSAQGKLTPEQPELLVHSAEAG
jgi:hypothetical protein